MPLVSDDAICLRKTEYSETSQILTLLTRSQGIVRLIAKGAHRRTKAGASRFDGGIDLLDEGQCIFTGDTSRELAILTDWKLREGHLELRRKLRGIYLAMYSAELVSMTLEEHDPHPEVFDSLQRTLTQLAGPPIEEAFLAFELELLRQTGFVPEFAQCANCHNPIGDREDVWFAASRSGIVCRNCHNSFLQRMTLDVRLLRLVRAMQVADPTRLPRLTRHQTDPLNYLLAEHIEHTLGKQPKLAAYILPRRRPNQFTCNSVGQRA
jgi:DNA repair protein RecO (recombination protein O)